MRLLLRSLFVLALAAASAVTLAASKPVFWQTATLNDFLRGEVENLSVDGHGRLVLGPATELVAETTSPFLWAMAVAPDGSHVRRQRQRGQGLQDRRAGKTATFFDTTELEVHALALAPDGSLYAATSPDGRIYKIDRSGKGAPFFDPEDKYIWSLALDAPGQSVRRHRREGADLQDHARTAKAAPFYATKATHVIALTFERNGQLLAGTEGPGRLFRVDRTGQGVPPARLDASRRFARSASIRRATSTSPR